MKEWIVKHKKILILFVIVVILILGFVIFTNTDTYKIAKGYELFGDEKCTRSIAKKEAIENGKYDISFMFYGDSDHPSVAGDAFTRWLCAICGKEDVNSNTACPTLCSECAKITNRCSYCGKILEEDV